MSHEIYEINGEASMAYVGELPWHGLGQELQPGQPISAWIKAAHLDWTAERAIVEFSTPGFRDQEIRYHVPMRHVLYRSDNYDHLSVVSDRFKVVQPEQIIEFFRDLVARHNFEIETAGSLNGGKIIWSLAKTGKDFALPDGDQISGYLLLMTSYDTKMSTLAKFVTVRTVCKNTLDMALRSGERAAVKVRHTSKFDPNQIKLDLGMYDNAWTEFTEDCQKLAATKLSEDQLVKYLVSIFHNPDNKDEDGKESFDDVPKRTLHKLLDLTLGGRGSNLESAKGTLWGAVNAVTEYYDHEAGRNNDSGLKSAWFGNGANIKNKAYAKAVKLAEDIHGNIIEVEVDVPIDNPSFGGNGDLDSLLGRPHGTGAKPTIQ